MLYSYGRLLLPHLPLDRETITVKLGDEVELQYYRLQRIHAGPIDLRQGEDQAVKSPTEVGTGKGGWPTFTIICVRHSNRGCPILAFFARVGGDAACAI